MQTVKFLKFIFLRNLVISGRALRFCIKIEMLVYFFPDYSSFWQFGVIIFVIIFDSKKQGSVPVTGTGSIPYRCRQAA